MRNFGLIGFPLEHSFSKKFFTEKFRSEGIADCTYENFPLKDIHELQQLLQLGNLSGLNVTIPYKEQVIPFLHEKDIVVKSLGACNCIKINKSGICKGYNTDVAGFRASLKLQLQPHHRNALVLGEGGAAKAVRYVLEESGIQYLTVTRRSHQLPGTIQYSELNEEIIARHNLIINTTPVGMYPNVAACPDIPYHAIRQGHYLYDLIYNPTTTEFLRRGAEQGAAISNGYDMLILQAEESWKIWNSAAL